MKILGIKVPFTGSNSIRLSNKKQVNSSSSDGSKKRATGAIRKQYKREVSFQIDDIKSAIQMASNPDTPDRKKLFEIMRYIMRDGHLKSQIKQAKLKVLSEPWLLYKDGNADEDTTALLSKKWFNLILEYILEEEWYSFSLVECDDINPQEFHIGSVALIDREYVSIEKQWILIEGTINGAYLAYGDIKDDIDLLEFGSRDEFGCLVECAYNVIWKYYARSDWSRANEKVGTPTLVVIADTNNDDELDDMETKAANFGTDGFIVGQKGDEITMLERKSDKFHETFKDVINICDEQVSKIINGQTGTSDVKAFVGAANVHERVMEDFTIARLQKVVDEVRENVMPYLIKKGFKLEGYEFNYPYLLRLKQNKINGQQNPDPSTEPAAAPQTTK
jgi:hypothetical protein